MPIVRVELEVVTKVELESKLKRMKCASGGRNVSNIAVHLDNLTLVDVVTEGVKVSKKPVKKRRKRLDNF